MTTRFTFRLDEKQRKKLRERAAVDEVSESAFLRGLLEREFEERPLRERIAHLAASIRLPRGKGDEWAAEIRRRNWRD